MGVRESNTNHSRGVLLIVPLLAGLTPTGCSTVEQLCGGRSCALSLEMAPVTQLVASRATRTSCCLQAAASLGAGSGGARRTPWTLWGHLNPLPPCQCAPGLQRLRLIWPKPWASNPKPCTQNPEFRCRPADVCEVGNGGCAADALCSVDEEAGVRTCACKYGYAGDGTTSCTGEYGWRCRGTSLDAHVSVLLCVVQFALASTRSLAPRPPAPPLRPQT